MHAKFAAIAVLSISALLAACAGSDAVRESPSGPAAGKSGAADNTAALKNMPSIQRLNFAFDSSEIDPAGAKVLKSWADHLVKYPDVQIVLEGHCDERGTTDYNISLGERRAIAARDSLLAMGASQNQITVISFGEERPLDARHTESAWRKNRRIEIIPQ